MERQKCSKWCSGIRGFHHTRFSNVGTNSVHHFCSADNHVTQHSQHLCRLGLRSWVHAHQAEYFGMLGAYPQRESTTHREPHHRNLRCALGQGGIRGVCICAPMGPASRNHVFNGGAVTCQLWKLYVETSCGTCLGKSAHGPRVTRKAMQHKNTSVASANVRKRFCSRNGWCGHRGLLQENDLLVSVCESLEEPETGSLTIRSVTGGLESHASLRPSSAPTTH